MIQNKFESHSGRLRCVGASWITFPIQIKEVGSNDIENIIKQSKNLKKKMEIIKNYILFNTKTLMSQIIFKNPKN